MTPSELLRRLRGPKLVELVVSSHAVALRGGADATSPDLPQEPGAAPRAIIPALEAVLAGLPPAARVRVCVDASWARMFAVPWLRELNTAQRRQRYAASLLAQRFGERPDDWVVRVLPAWPPHARLAVALPGALVDAIERTCGARLAGLHVDLLRWLEPALAARRGWSGCAVEVDDLQAWVFVFRRGELMRVRTRRQSGAQALASVIVTEWAACAGEGVPGAVLYGPRASAAGYDVTGPETARPDAAEADAAEADAAEAEAAAGDRAGAARAGMPVPTGAAA